MEQVRAERAQDLSYILGHSEDELDRLVSQARFLGDLTEQVVRLAGLRRGMRVLDVGCGTGDVSFLVARVVGPEGRVIGVDKSPEAVCVATKRARDAGLTNVQFVHQDLHELVLDDPVDALVGRLVLMYFADPADLLRRLSGFLKPGGVALFQEIDAGGARSLPSCAVYETAGRRITQTFARAGIDLTTSLKLGQIFEQAGLPDPRMTQLARVERGPDSPAYAYVAQMVRTLLPLMQRTGVATADEVDIETLADRMREEALARDATLVLPPLVAAWARKGPC